MITKNENDVKVDEILETSWGIPRYFKWKYCCNFAGNIL